MAKVSVIIPVYGVEKYIERCVDSLFRQTLTDIEYIFVDDCTPDRSIELLKEKIEMYKLHLIAEKKIVRIVRMSTNSGQATVRRHGIQLASGDFIIHCDSDDWVDIDMLEKMWTYAIDNNCDTVVCNYVRTDGTVVLPNHMVLPEYDITPLHAVSLLLQSKIPTSVWTKLVKSELYKDSSLIFPQHDMWEDFLFSTQLLYKSKRIGFVNKGFYKYYMNPQSICNTNIDRRVDGMVANCNEIIKFLQSCGIIERFVDEIQCLKLSARSELVNFCYERKYRHLWHEIFPEVGIKFIFNRCLSIRQKVRYLFIYLNIYQIFYRIKYG